MGYLKYPRLRDTGAGFWLDDVQITEEEYNTLHDHKEGDLWPTSVFKKIEEHRNNVATIREIIDGEPGFEGLRAKIDGEPKFRAHDTPDGKPLPMNHVSNFQQPKQDDRSVAQKTLEAALDIVMKQRQNAHGDAENSFAMIGQLWMAYLKGKPQNSPLWITAFDVAQMMVLLKIARAVHGNGEHGDHYIDAAGYTSLAAMLAGAKINV